MMIQPLNFVLDYYKSLLSPSSSFGYCIVCFDIFLFVVNLFQFYVFITPLTDAGSPLKKPTTRLNYRFRNSHLHHGTPAMFHIATIGVLCAIIGYIWMDDGNNNGKADKYAFVRFVAVIYTFACTVVLGNVTNSWRIPFGPPDRHDPGIPFQPPSKEIANAIVSPVAALLHSDVTGIDNVQPNEPSLFVMNHSLYGLETGLFYNTIYQQKDIFLRGLTDHFHFAMPYRELFRKLGAVDGTRENVDILMKQRQHVLVYLGGAHEMYKHSSVPKYALLWKERLGFARMAIKHGYPIQPCAAVGTEDMFDIMFHIPVRFFRKDLFIPIPYPVSPNKLQKVYFWFGEPIPTKQYNGDYKNDVYAREVRDKAKHAIENAIQQLQVKQINDPNRFLMKQFANKLWNIRKCYVG